MKYSPDNLELKVIKSNLDSSGECELFITEIDLFSDSNKKSVFSFIGLISVANYARFGNNPLMDEIEYELDLPEDYLSILIASNDKATKHATNYLLGEKLANKCFNLSEKPVGLYEIKDIDLYQINEIALKIIEDFEYVNPEIDKMLFNDDY